MKLKKTLLQDTRKRGVFFRGRTILWMLVAFGVCVAGLARPSLAQREFDVFIDPSVASKPVSGRLLLFLIKEGAKLKPGTEPLEGPFWDDPQPIYGADIVNLGPDAPAIIGDKADVFPADMKMLPPGNYRVQARLDVARNDSNWRRHDGNLYSDVVDFAVVQGVPARPVHVTLMHETRVEAPKKVEGLEWFEVRSKLLSDFRGRDVVLRAGVVLPKDFDAKKKYAAVYEVPGFGGNHADAVRVARARDRNFGDETLARSCFWIVLDPEGPNGHTLFADSANNGPCGEALVKELIPALEAKFSLLPDPKARLLRGHSSGGWSTLWLATTYPGVFGACWSSSPDPVDFRKLQLINIYEQPNFYVNERDGKKAEIPSFRGNGTLMTVRQEARGEDVLGPDNTSAQQWDSWFAVFGPRNDRGHPKALFDPETGVIDKAVAESYRAFDIADRLRKDPAKYAPIFRERVRLVVGDHDSFYLNEAVALLKTDLDRLPASPDAKATASGYIKILPGYDHGTIFGSKEIRGFSKEMIDYLDGVALSVK